MAAARCFRTISRWPVVGGLILWFGWYGFNPCSTLSIMDAAGVGRVAMNTTLAACTGGLAAVFLMYSRVKDLGRARDGQWLFGRPGGNYVSLLLGQ